MMNPQNNNNPNASTNKTGHLKLIEKLKGKNIVKIFASNGCEHVVALTSKIYFKRIDIYFR